MKATTVAEVVQALEAGKGPVEVTLSLSRELATQHPALFDHWAAVQRVARFGCGPYTGTQWAAFELRIGPDPDPVSRAEQKARGRFDKKLSEATEREAVARAAYEVAESVYLDLFGRSLAAGNPEPGFSGRYEPIPVSREAIAEHSALKAELAAAHEVFSEAEDRFRRANLALNKLLAQIDFAVHCARA